jgi:uncharacterized membrane protein
MEKFMKKLLITTALSLSLLNSGITYADDLDDTQMAVSKEYNDNMGKSPLADLPKDKVDLFRTTMRQVHEGNKQFHLKMKGLREDLSKITKAPNFDEKAYIAKSIEIADLKKTMQANRTKAIAGFLNKLTADERSKFADAMQNRKHSHMKKWHKGTNKSGIEANK